MNRKSNFITSRLLTLIALVGLLLGACSAGESGAPVAYGSGLAAWLDQPPDGYVLPLASFALKAHARDAAQGVIEIDFEVNDIPLGAVATDAGAGLAYAEIPWNPSSPGSYRIKVWGVNAAGVKVSSTVSVVCVTDAKGAGCPGGYPLPAPVQKSCQQLKTCTATPAPTDTDTLLVTATVEPVTKAEVNFMAASTELNVGQCTTLSWNVKSATSVSLDNLSVGGTDQRQVCPSVTTKYVLHVVAPSGNVDSDILINVLILQHPSPTPTELPNDFTGPDVFNYAASPDPSHYLGAGCGSTVTTFGATITDPAGFGPVRIMYSYGTNWQSVDAEAIGAGMYRADIDNDAGFQAQSVLAGVDGTITWYVDVRDAGGNIAKISEQYVPILACPPS